VDLINKLADSLISKPDSLAEKERAAKLAQRLGTHIHGGIDIRFWALPLIEALLDRIEQLEKK
jgi:hypothetical protein